MTELPHILVVDDDTRLRELLRKYLTEQGFRVTAAANAADARAKLASLESRAAPVCVVDSGSGDSTGDIARAAGVTVVFE